MGSVAKFYLSESTDLNWSVLFSILFLLAELASQSGEELESSLRPYGLCVKTEAISSRTVLYQSG